MNQTLAITGHRPDKLGGYSDEVYTRLVRMYTHVFTDLKPARVISGMALGADQAAAEAALGLGIPVTAAVPFTGQESKWPAASQARYREMLAGCTVIVVSEGGYSTAAMQRRNEWMVDHADLLLTLWNGSSGGTRNCVDYAHRVGRNIIHLWKFWEGWAG